MEQHGLRFQVEEKWETFPIAFSSITIDDSNRSLLLLEATKYFLRHLFASTFVYQTVSSTDNKRQQAKRYKRQNFHFHANVSSCSTRPKTGTGRPANPWLTSDRKQTSCMKIKSKKKRLKHFSLDPSTSNAIRHPIWIPLSVNLMLIEYNQTKFWHVIFLAGFMGTNSSKIWRCFFPYNSASTTLCRSIVWLVWNLGHLLTSNLEPLQSQLIFTFMLIFATWVTIWCQLKTVNSCKNQSHCQCQSFCRCQTQKLYHI